MNALAELTESSVRWRVAHTRPRCEKKVALLCAQNGLDVSLPLYRSVKKYQSKQVVFQKPLFPGYVFFRADPRQAGQLRQEQPVAQVLTPADDAEFAAQLEGILQALTTEREVRFAPEITLGQRVRIRSGPLRGMEGQVERRAGVWEIFLRLDFIGQAAAVQVTADEVESV